MALYFITSNKNKFAEAKAIISYVQQIDIDLPEIQELDAKAIITAKLAEASRHHHGEFIVEDTSLYLDALNGFSGPLIKWFMQSVGNEGIYEIVNKKGNMKAYAKTVVGYGKNPHDFQYFEGVVEGEIVAPRGKSDFGWDPIFQPRGSAKSFVEMTRQEKNDISMRKIALEKLKTFLDKKNE